MTNVELNNMLEECLEECSSVGISTVSSSKFNVSVSGRLTSSWGNIRKSYNGYDIRLSKKLLTCEKQAIKTTLMHEVLHSVKGCMNHGDKWKCVAEKVNKSYGYNIKRCTSSKEKGYVEEPRTPIAEVSDGLYQVRCLRCNHVTHRQKMSKLIKNTNSFRCSCGGKLERIK